MHHDFCLNKLACNLILCYATFWFNRGHRNYANLVGKTVYYKVFFLFKSQVKNGWDLSQPSQVVLPLGPVSVSDSGLNQKPGFGPRLQYVCEIVNN